MNQNKHLLHAFWRRFTSEPWMLGLALIIAWGIPRFWLVMQANVSGAYQWVSFVFLSMWIAPWIFLSKSGRRKIGWKRPESFPWLLYAFVLGMLCCAVMYLIAEGLYDKTISNWFVYISHSYASLPWDLEAPQRLTYFWIFAGTSMVFSPIGEELFYRGIVHECFAEKWNDRIAAYVDSAAFSITHLAHFGIVYVAGNWLFLPLPAALWMITLFVTCLLFSLVRRKSGSILGAMLAHAGFNFAMTYFIFFHIL